MPSLTSRPLAASSDAVPCNTQVPNLKLVMSDLEKLDVLDNVPALESANAPISYELGSSSLHGQDGQYGNEYFEEKAFNLPKIVIEENLLSVEISKLLQEAEKFVNILYVGRSCARTLVPVSGNEEELLRKEIHLRSFGILQPEMEKLANLNILQQKIVNFVVGRIIDPWLEEKNCGNRSMQNKTFILGGDTINGVIKLIDVLVRLDSVKDMKASLLNDFSAFKRAFHNCKLMLENEEQVALQIKNLQLFLADPGCPKHKILTTLKYALFKNDKKRLGGVIDFMTTVFEWTLERHEEELFIFPEEKWMLIRTLPYVMWLMDCKDEIYGTENVFKNKKVMNSAFIRIFNTHPIVPLYNEMHLALIHVIHKCPNFDKNSSICSQFNQDITIPSVAKVYSLNTYWNKIIEQYETYVPRFVNVVNRVKKAMQGDSNSKSVKVGLSHLALDVTVEGLRLLSQWKELIVAQAAYKYATPVDLNLIKKAMGGDAEHDGSHAEFPYERVVRYNYTGEDLAVLLKAVSVLKSLSSYLQRNEYILASAIRVSVHAHVQDFVQVQLMEMLHKLDAKSMLLSPRKKVKKGISPAIGTNLDSVEEILLKIREIAADWLDAESPTFQQDYKIKPEQRQKKLLGDPRKVSASQTQTHLLLKLIGYIENAMFAQNQKKSKSGTLKSAFKTLKPTSQKSKSFDLVKGDFCLLKGFYDRAILFPYLLALGNTCRILSNIGELYFREFYLEMTKCVQFPIATSLPWIMTRELIENPSTTGENYGKNSNNSGNFSPMVCLLYSLDVYNDAADIALNRMKNRFLYDEIEAEVNLVFDQLTFLVSDHLYSFAKLAGVESILSKNEALLKKLKKTKRYSILTPNKTSVDREGKNVVDIESKVNDSTHADVNVSKHVAEKKKFDHVSSCMKIEPKYYRRFEIVLQQRHINLLGRSIDLNLLVSKVIHSKIVTDIEFIIYQFECGDITNVTEFKTQLEMIASCRDLMAKSIDIEPFPTLLDQCNRNVSSSTGRAYRHIIGELQRDFFPKMCYDQITESFSLAKIQPQQMLRSNENRSVFSKLLYGAPSAVKKLEAIHRVDRGVFTKKHMEAIFHYDNMNNVDNMIHFLLKTLSQKINSELVPYVLAIHDVLPDIRLTKYETGTDFSLLSFQSQLNQLLLYEDLKKAFGAFKYIGNVCAFCYMMQTELDRKQSLSYIQVAPFVGFVQSLMANSVAEHSEIKIDETSLHKTIMAVRREKEDAMEVEEDVRMVQRVCQYEIERVGERTFIFRKFLEMVEASLQKSEFKEKVDNDKLLKVFSALQFIYCNNWNDDLEEPPTSFLWGGTLLLFLTGQVNKFDHVDLVSHILRVSAIEYSKSETNSTSKRETNANSEQFLAKAKKLRRDINSITGLLEASIEPEENDITVFHPPKWDAETAYGYQTSSATAVTNVKSF